MKNKSNKSKKVQAGRRSKKKEKEVFLPVLLLVFALIFFVIGIFPAYFYKNTKDRCTAETTGTVVYEGKGLCSAIDTNSGKYLIHGTPYKRKNRIYWREISVETDDIFKYKKLYAASYVGNKGDKVIIRYDPYAPDEYYFENCYNNNKAVAILALGVSGSMIVLSLFLFIHYKKAPRSAKKQSKKRV